MNSSVQQTHLDFVETDANKDGIVTMPEYLTSNYPIYESYEMSSPNPKKLAGEILAYLIVTWPYTTGAF